MSTATQSRPGLQIETRLFIGGEWVDPAGSDVIERRVENGAAPGVVVLTHDAGGDRSQSVQALRAYLPRLLDSGYRIIVPRRNR